MLQNTYIVSYMQIVMYKENTIETVLLWLHKELHLSKIFKIITYKEEMKNEDKDATTESSQQLLGWKKRNPGMTEEADLSFRLQGEGRTTVRRSLSFLPPYT